MNTTRVYQAVITVLVIIIFYLVSHAPPLHSSYPPSSSSILPTDEAALGPTPNSNNNDALTTNAAQKEGDAINANFSSSSSPNSAYNAVSYQQVSQLSRRNARAKVGYHALSHLVGRSDRASYDAVNEGEGETHLVPGRMDEITSAVAAPPTAMLLPPNDEDTYKSPIKYLNWEIAQLLRQAREEPPALVPKIVHFIHGLKDKDVRFTFIHYLAIKAAYDNIKPDAIYLHCINFHNAGGGANEWWERARSMVLIRRARTVNTIFGNKVEHFAHKADILRLELLLTYGGIYLDIDVIALKPFDHLLQYDMVLGEEQRYAAPGPHGLGNGVIIAKRDSSFLKEWYRAYKMFDSTKWSEMSIHFPAKLAQLRPGAIKILPPTAFYTPCWDGRSAKLFYERNDYDLTPNLAVHVWSSDKQRVNGPADICFLKNLFGRILRLAFQGGEQKKDNQCPPGAMHNMPERNDTAI